MKQMQREGKAAFEKEFGQTLKKNKKMLAERIQSYGGQKTYERLYNQGKVSLRKKYNRPMTLMNEEDLRKTTIRFNKFETSPSRNELYASLASTSGFNTGLLSPNNEAEVNRSSSVSRTRQE